MSDKWVFEVQSAHKHFSATCFNRAWEYIDKTDRNQEDDLNMLLTALASLWHWKQREDVTATNLSVGYWQVARVYALMGQVENARQFGLLSLHESLKEGVEPFYLGYSHEALARADALSGDLERKATHLMLAHEACAKIADQEAKKMLLDDMATIH
jgi:hypothetical protein